MSDDQNTVDGLELINCIASGTQSQIWEVGEPGGAQHFAMKLLVPEAMEEKENISVLKHEAKVQKSLVHPNFITMHRVVANKQNAYILMDYFRAPNVKSQLMTDLLGLQIRVTKLIEGLCVALAYMHDKGWVHRDIKPENILFNKSGELKLIDFSLSLRAAGGLGKMFGGTPKTIQGTRTYIAPETILKKPPTPQTDMYSLGVTLFEVLAGQRPFTAPTPDILLNKHLKEAAPLPSEFNRNVTPEADEFIRRMLFKKPDKRHGNMNEMLAEFRSLKIFKEDVAALKAQDDARKKELAEAGGDLSKAWTLDSRQDAYRTKKGIAPPVKPQPRKPNPPKPEKKPSEPAAKQPPAPAQPEPPQPGAYPQYAPPGYMPPGMYPPQPGMPYPQQPYPQQPYPQQPYPQQPYPQQPYPPQQYPQQGAPPGYPPMPPGAPPAQQPQPGQAQPGQAQPGQQPQPPAQQPQPTEQTAPQPPASPQPASPQPASPQPAPAQQPQPTQQAAPQPPTPQQPAAPQTPPAPAAQPNQSAPQQQPAAATPAPKPDDADEISRDEVELRPQHPITGERHASQKEDDRDLPVMEELPDIV